ncbi:Protein of unknown function [Actinoplanes derwentensis]|uniref:ABC-2 type transporter transmembrane domain-containing protein n=1 Tax=Actinoplanes derwentensis TaxID=113562 RepID=A0A1H1TE78_9ACTN|nr:ABC transporter permease [Actinoplanes derwentensis]SDS58256.1 Protein of unknown function [Actinoplanes derwentensis]
MIVLLSIALPACYLSGIADPQAHLRNLPVGLVLTPQEPGGTSGAAEALAEGIRTGADPDKIDVTTMTATEMSARFADDEIYGAVVIPADFERSLSSLTSNDAIVRPVVTVRTNAGEGSLAVGLVSGNLGPVLAAAQRTLGDRLRAAAGTGLTPAQSLVLQEPFTVSTMPDQPLPAESGYGLTPFYLALVAILIGFIGASTIHPSLDAAIGFAPSELGPLTSRRPYQWAGRVTTLLAKFAVLTGVAPVAAALLQLVATTVIGVPVSHPVELWLLLTATIIAVGVGTLSVFAAFGSPGALINTFFFVALSLASGPTVPVEALPGWLRSLNTVTAMNPVLDGVRAILFFDARGAAGLSHAWIRLGIGAAAGAALGLLAAWLYDRNPRLTRHPLPSTPADAPAPVPVPQT